MNEYEHLRFLKDNDSELSEELNTFESPLFDNLQDENLPNVFLERSEESVDESTNEDATSIIMIVYNHGNIQPNAFPIPPQYQMAAFNRWDSTSTMPISSYTGCTFNNYFQKPPSPKSPRKKRRVLMFDSDDEE